MQAPSCVELLNQWQRQFSFRQKRGGSRGIGALGWVVEGKQTGELVELERLLFVVVYDEQFASEKTAVRVGTYRASRIEHGVQYGGPANARLYKDMMLSPRPGGGHLRLDLYNMAVLDRALRLNRRIDVALRFQPRISRRGLRLPRLWAAFSPEVACGLAGSGPEFEALCGRFGVEPDLMLRKFERERDGLALYPLEWVSDRLAAASAVLVERTGFPSCQVFGVASPEVDLVGYSGAAAFDFYSYNFRACRNNARRGGKQGTAA